ncbi:uncharacterized protein [Nicotiana sylvestris]|uniref:uncharacterized protein n=1 Tax=Nicotiana sylvestris TaxID=4096 RepID=UPI00388C973B
MNTSKELWEALEKKYNIEDACLKKFVVAKFLDYKMIDNKTVGTQVQELQLIFHDLIAEVEEDSKTAEKKSRRNSTIMGANIVEETAPKNKKRKRSSGQTKEQNRKKFKGNCYNYGKVGHKSPDCRLPKKDKKKGQANIVENNDDIDDLCAMLSEYNLVGNQKEWWIDSGATQHVCAVKEAFATYSTAGPEKEISMGNNATAKIEGYGKIFLKMTSGKNGFKCVFVSDKVVVSKNEMYVGKGYLTEGLFKLDVMVVDSMSKISASSYLLESNDLCKDETIEAFKQYKNDVENQLNEKIKMIRSDRGGEYESLLSEICSEYGIIHQTTAPYTPQSNEIAKRKNQKLKEMMNSLLISSELPQITRITSIRVLVALAAVYGLEIHQIDVKTAFVNGELEEEIYMEQPEGFVVPGKEKKVRKLVKSLYGLKQAPKQWHEKFDQTILTNGFKINECDKCVYIKNTPGHEVIVCLYVNDMLIMSKSMTDINAAKCMLACKFDMKDLGVADVILGIRIHKTPQGLALS